MDPLIVYPMVACKILKYRSELERVARVLLPPALQSVEIRIYTEIPQHPLGHLSLMLIKPVLFFGGVGMALSMWRQPQRDA